MFLGDHFSWNSWVILAHTLTSPLNIVKNCIATKQLPTKLHVRPHKLSTFDEQLVPTDKNESTVWQMNTGICFVFLLRGGVGGGWSLGCFGFFWGCCCFSPFFVVGVQPPSRYSNYLWHFLTSFMLMTLSGKKLNLSRFKEKSFFSSHVKIKSVKENVITFMHRH